jgi:hypothetical protein
MNLEFIIIFNLLNYEIKYVVNECEFYVKKGNEWRLKKFYVMNSGYLQTIFSFEKNKQTHIYKHRLVFYAYNQDFEIFRKSRTDNMIDHVDGNPSNNRIENLRLVTHQQNHFNQTKARGYCWYKRYKKWMAHIHLDRKQKNLGYFDTEQEAREAYLKAKKIYHII